MLEIIYASTMKYLEEGKNLDWNCLIRHQQNQLSQIDAHRYKRANKENKAGFGKEIESLHLSQSADPVAKVMSSLKTCENISSQPVRQCLPSVQNQNKEYFPNCCGPLHYGECNREYRSLPGTEQSSECGFWAGEDVDCGHDILDNDICQSAAPQLFTQCLGH